MFDSISYKGGNLSHHVTFNSVAGTLVKSSEKSKFMRFHMNSDLAKMVFHRDKPHKYKAPDYPYEKSYIVVLQVMLCGDGEFLIEYIDEEKEED